MPELYESRRRHQAHAAWYHQHTCLVRNENALLRYRTTAAVLGDEVPK